MNATTLNMIIAIGTFVLGGGLSGVVAWLRGLSTTVHKTADGHTDLQATLAAIQTEVQKGQQLHDQLVAALQQKQVLPTPPQIMPPAQFDPAEIEQKIDAAVARLFQNRLASPTDNHLG